MNTTFRGRASQSRRPGSEQREAARGVSRRASFAVVALGMTLAAVGMSQAKPMSGAEIDKSVRGKRVFLQTPLGGEFPLHYRADGVVDGSGEAVGLGRFMAPTDQGKWWIADNRLCQQWREWYDGRRQCFVLTRTGDSTLYWQRDDGLEGEARIGR